MEFIVFQIAILVFSVVLHEVSHGAIAYSLGDTTAKNAGRLTLNPIPHIDPFGSVILPFMLLVLSQATGGGGIILGWAKPVPVNPFNLRDQKFGMLKVALAGPGSNLIIALVFGFILRFLPAEALNPFFGVALASIVYLNLVLALFNLLPIPPLDGSNILFSFLPRSFDSIKIFLLRYGFFILLFLVFSFPGILSILAQGLFRIIVGS